MLARLPALIGFALVVILVPFLASIATEANQTDRFPKPLPVPKKATLKARWENAAGHRGNEWLIAFSKDGKLAFFDQHSGRLVARDTTTWKKAGLVIVDEKELPPSRSDLTAVSPDGRLAVSFSRREEKDKPTAFDIALEDRKTRKVLARATIEHPPVFLFTPDSKTLISASYDAVILWDVPRLRIRRTFGPVNGYPRSLVLSPDGQTLGIKCVADFFLDNQFWDLKTGRLKAALSTHIAQVWNLAFSPDGKTLVSSGNDAQLKVWDSATGLGRLTIPLHFDSSHARQKVVYHPDGRSVAVGERSVVRFYDTRTGKAGTILRGHTSAINDLAFSPDGTRLASASGTTINRLLKAGLPGDRQPEPGEVIIWDLKMKKARHVLKAYKGKALAVAWSPDGRKLLTRGNPHPDAQDGSEEAGETKEAHALHLWNAETGKLIRSFAGSARDDISPIAFNPDGKTFVHTKSPNIIIIDVATGKEVRALRTGGNAIAFRKDGKLLAVVGGGGGVNLPSPGFIELWDPHTGKRIAQRAGHTTGINAVAFHPDGTALATAGSDRAVWMWDIIDQEKK
jgi:WD40 repeat protein